MDLSRHQATENQFLGSLLGMAIGDALGRPLRGLTRDDIRRQHDEITAYIRDAELPRDQPPGEISDKTEVVLALVESLTTNDGLVDPVNINTRLSFLVRGPSRDGMSAATVAGIESAFEADGLVPANLASAPEIAVALRGVPVGLLHAVGGFDEQTLRRESAEVSRLTHGGDAQRDLTATVARAVCAAARFGSETDRWVDILGPLSPTDDARSETVRDIVLSVKASGIFEDSVLATVSNGGDADAMGALAGAVAGARFGASGIPQELIDGLDARIYVSLAAPWFFRTTMRRAGTVIDLRLIE